MGVEQLLQMDSRPLFRRTSPSRLEGAGLLECNTGFFRFRHNFHAHIAAVIERFQFLKSQYSKKIPVQQKQAIPKSKGSLVCVLHHLNHMGGI